LTSALAVAACSADEFGTADASPSTDSGSDVPADRSVQDAAPPSPCASPHLFCDDFDGPEVFPKGKWDSATITSGAALLGPALRSAPNAAVLSTDPSDASNQYAGPSLTKTVPAQGSLHCHFVVRAGSAWGSSPHYLFALSAIPGPNASFKGWFAGVIHDESNATTTLQDVLTPAAGADQIANLSNNGAFAATTHEIEVRVSVKDQQASLTIDGKTSTGPTKFPPQAATDSILLLHSTAGVPAETSVSYDDVWCDGP
jgi:hypothetical protein